MRSPLFVLGIALLAALALGCTRDSAESGGQNVAEDTSSPSGVDAVSVADTGEVADASVLDSGQVDGTSLADSGQVEDASAADSGQVEDASAADSGPVDASGADVQRIHPLDNTEVYIRNRWGCPAGAECGMHLGWDDITGDGTRTAVLFPKENTADLVRWRLKAASNEAGVYYIRSGWGCPGAAQCDMHLGWAKAADGVNALVLYPVDNTEDLVAWKIVPASQDEVHFNIRNTWGCATVAAECDSHVGWKEFGGHIRVQLFPVDDSANLTPWEITVAP